MAKSFQRDNIYLVDIKYNITYQNIRGKLRSALVFTITPKVTLQLTWMSILQNREVCFNQEKLPTTYQNFSRKCLVSRKSKSPN